MRGLIDSVSESDREDISHASSVCSSAGVLFFVANSFDPKKVPFGQEQIGWKGASKDSEVLMGVMGVRGVLVSARWGSEVRAMGWTGVGT